MNRICQPEKCCGCGLCSNVCPRNAIEMIENSRTGHFVPMIREADCIHCGICEKMCPSNQNADFSGSPIHCFAGWTENSQIRDGSSSGGVAASLYHNAIREHYVVTGVAMNPDFTVSMKLAATIEDCEPFKGSKYLQANCGMVYRQIQEALKNKQKVLFVGTPCQCAAARSVAGKAIDQLLTAEIVCHGVPSQRIFRDYINSIEKKKHKKIKTVSFRSSYGEAMTLSDGDRLVWSRIWKEDEFLFAFQMGLIQNHCCTECPYARPERLSDITIGDFWGLGKKIPFQKPDNRVSVVLANTAKGLDFLQSCPDLHLEERPFEEALAENTNLRSPAQSHPLVESFWDVYQQNGLDAAFVATIGPEVRKNRLNDGTIRKVKKIIKRILKFA